MESGLLKGA